MTHAKTANFKPALAPSLPLVLLMAAILLTAAFSVNRAHAATIFLDEFSNKNQGWLLDDPDPNAALAMWGIGAATISPPGAFGFNLDPRLDHSPGVENGVAGVVIGGNAPTNKVHPFKYITSRPISVLGYDGTVMLEFFRWLNSDYIPYMNNVVEVYDGTTWNRLWESGAAPSIKDSEWTLQTFDITAIADTIGDSVFPLLQVRFGYNIGAAGAYTVSSSNIDDVKIYNTVATVAEPGALFLLLTALGGLGLFGQSRKRVSA